MLQIIENTGRLEETICKKYGGPGQNSYDCTKARMEKTPKVSISKTNSLNFDKHFHRFTFSKNNIDVNKLPVVYFNFVRILIFDIIRDIKNLLMLTFTPYFLLFRLSL